MAAPWYFDGSAESVFHFQSGWFPPHVLWSGNEDEAIGNEENPVAIPFIDVPEDWDARTFSESVTMSGGWFNDGGVAYKVKSQDWSQQSGTITGTEVSTRSFYWNNADSEVDIQEDVTGSPDLSNGTPTYSSPVYSSAVTSSDISDGWSLVPLPRAADVGSGSVGSVDFPDDFLSDMVRYYYRVGINLDSDDYQQYSSITFQIRWVEYEIQGTSVSSSETEIYSNQETGDQGFASEYGEKPNVDIDDLPWDSELDADDDDVYAFSSTAAALPNMNATLDSYYNSNRDPVFNPIPTDCRVGLQFTPQTLIAKEEGKTTLSVSISGFYYDENFDIAEGIVQADITLPTSFLTDITADISSMVDTWVSDFVTDEFDIVDGTFSIEVDGDKAGLVLKFLTDQRINFYDGSNYYRTKTVRTEVTGDNTVTRDVQFDYGDFFLGKRELTETVEQEFSGSLKTAQLTVYTGGNVEKLHSSTEEVLFATLGNTKRVQIISLERA